MITVIDYTALLLLHPFNGPFSETTQVSRYQNGKTNLDFTEARDSEWQCHQLGHMQVCISLHTDDHASTPPLSFYRPDALPATQPAASNHRWKLYNRTDTTEHWWHCLGIYCIGIFTIQPDIWICYPAETGFYWIVAVELSQSSSLTTSSQNVFTLCKMAKHDCI